MQFDTSKQFVVTHQRYADNHVVRSVVWATSHAEANRKVWPKFSDEDWAWLITEQETEWDIPF